MNSLEIEGLVMSRFSQWEYFDKKTTARANQDFTPPKGQWCRVSLQGGINRISSINQATCIQELGLVIIQLFELENLGTAKLKAKADSLARHLGCYQKDRLELLAPSIINAGQSNGYYQINVQIPYRYY